MENYQSYPEFKEGTSVRAKRTGEHGVVVQDSGSVEKYVLILWPERSHGQIWVDKKALTQAKSAANYISFKLCDTVRHEKYGVGQVIDTAPLRVEFPCLGGVVKIFSAFSASRFLTIIEPESKFRVGDKVSSILNGVGIVEASDDTAVTVRFGVIVRTFTVQEADKILSLVQISEAPKPKFKVGDKVSSAVFGVGEVTKVYGSVLRVQFMGVDMGYSLDEASRYLTLVIADKPVEAPVSELASKKTYPGDTIRYGGRRWIYSGHEGDGSKLTKPYHKLARVTDGIQCSLIISDQEFKDATK